MDDVQYLLKSAKEESYLFVVDSRLRDASVYPTPSEYEIEFASPFRNVFGLDLIDATVARTEYIVESNANSLDYVMGTPSELTGESGSAWNLGEWVTASPAPRRTVALEPGDYNLPQFVDQLNERLAAAAAANGEPPIKAAALTNPAELSNRIVFTCQAPFTFLMATSTLRHTLGFGDPVRAAETADYRAVPGWSPGRTGGASDVFVCKQAAVQDANPASATLGPIPAGAEVQVDAVYGSRALRQYFESQAAGPVTQVLAYAHRLAGGPALTVRVVRVSDGVAMATGVLDPGVQDPNDSYVPASVAMQPSGVLQAGAAYYVEFVAVGAAGGAGAYTGVYYNADNLPVSGARYVSLDGVTVHAGEQLCCDVVCSSYGYALTTPGLVNLTGPRYVNIRCPDIESYMFRDRVNETVHVGLGMVKLGGYGFREQRFDFVSFPPRRFHPVGRMTKLRFRLERPDGSLYDSHGVDHTLLLVVRYYSLPASSAEDAAGAHARLNPEYVPDLRRYNVERRWPDEVRANTERATKFY